MRTVPFTLSVFCAAALAACQPERTPVAQQSPASATPTESERPSAAEQSPSQFARSLSPVSVEAGARRFPLRDGAEGVWRPVRPGVALTPSDAGMGVAYTRTRGKAAGAALVVRPGELADVQTLTLRLSSPGAVTVNACLTQEDGSVWALPPVRVSDGTVEVSRAIADAEWDPYQNNGRTRVPFDASKVYMVTFLDLAGFMGGSEGEVAWTVVSLKGGAK